MYSLCTVYVQFMYSLCTGRVVLAPCGPVLVLRETARGVVVALGTDCELSADALLRSGCTQ